MVRIQLLGGATLRRGDAPVTGPPAQRHRVALLALLAASWPHAVTRDRAQALLWPEHDRTSARRLLNLAVHVLRRALGDDVLASAGDGLLFGPEHVSCDVHVFTSAVRDARVDAAVAAWGGPFLSGFHLPDAPEFDYWLEERRAEFAHAYERSLVELAARQAAAGDVHAAVATCRMLVTADPYSGAYACLLMDALSAANDPAGALRFAAEHTRRLRVELDIDPAPEVSACVPRLQATSGATHAPDSGARVPGAPPLVAVMSGGAARSAATDGLNDELRDRMIGRLVQLRSVTVAAMPGAELRLAALAAPHRRGVDALVETTARIVAGRLRVKVRMVDAAQGVYLLSRQWDAPLDDAAGAAAANPSAAVLAGGRAAHALDALVDEAVEAIGRVVTARPATERVTDTALEEARMLCAKGQHFCAKREETALLRAIACFERARELAPGWAPACTGLASAWAVLGFYDLAPPREAFSLAKRAAQKARALNPANPEAHASLGYIAKYYEWNWLDAERELADAIHLDPQLALGHQWLGNYLVLRGRFAEAVASMDRAVQLAPHSAIATAASGWARSFAGEHHRALERLAEAAELDPALPMAQLWRGQALIELGEHDEAVRALRVAVDLSPTSAAAEAALAYGLARGGDHDAARALLRTLTTRTRTQYVASYEVAKVHLALGDVTRALHWLGRAFRERSHSMGLLRVDPQLTALHDNPAFHRLLHRVGHR